MKFSSQAASLGVTAYLLGDEAYIRAKERKPCYDVIREQLKAAFTLEEIEAALEEARKVNCLYIDEAVDANKRRELMSPLGEAVKKLEGIYNNLPNLGVWTEADVLAFTKAIADVDEVDPLILLSLILYLPCNDCTFFVPS